MNSKETLLYRLQLASRTSNDRGSNTWKTVSVCWYQGVRFFSKKTLFRGEKGRNQGKMKVLCTSLRCFQIRQCELRWIRRHSTGLSVLLSGTTIWNRHVQIYEGVSTSYSLSTSESVQLRVQCVRMRDGVESVSSPSAVQFATPSVSLASHRKAQEVIEDEEITFEEETSGVDWIRYHVLSDKHYALVILVCFIIFCNLRHHVRVLRKISSS